MGKPLLAEGILQRWYAPVLLFFASTVPILLSAYGWRGVLAHWSESLFVLGGMALLVASVWQLAKGKWYWGLLQLGVLAGGGAAVVCLVAFSGPFSPSRDTFALGLSLPKDTTLHEPLPLAAGKSFEVVRPDSMRRKRFATPHFVLYQGFQPGLYAYDVWVAASAADTLYLRAYEITTEARLSPVRLAARSALAIAPTGGEVCRFAAQGDFTIYEGDWGQPYGARFEVWRKPALGGAEEKIMEKNYRIEGWMR